MKQRAPSPPEVIDDVFEKQPENVFNIRDPDPRVIEAYNSHVVNEEITEPVAALLTVAEAIYMLSDTLKRNRKKCKRKSREKKS